MKLKRIITGSLLALTMAFGVGVGVGANRKAEVKEAKADTTFTKGQNLYLVPGVWNTGGAAFVAYFCNGTSGDEARWLTYDSSGNDWYNAKYHVAVPNDGYKTVVFCRMNPTEGSETGSGWNIYIEGSGTFHVWNQTSDVDAGSWDKCSITGWNQSDHTQSNASTSDFDSWKVATWSPDTNQNLTGYQNNSDGSQIYNTSVTLTAGGRFKVVNITKNWYIGSNGFEDGSVFSNGYLEKTAGEGDVNILKSGTYEVYVKLKTKTVWVQLSSSAEATIYANEFLTIADCTNTSVKFNLTDWNKADDSETTSLEGKFNHLTSGARNILIGTTGSEGGNAVEQCIARYDRILSKYGYGTASGQYHDFMGRTPARIGSSAVIVGLNNKTTTNSVIVVVVVSITAIAAAGFFFFFYKKKNQ